MTNNFLENISNDWIALHEELPPLDVEVECLGHDYMGQFTVFLKRTFKKTPKPHWKWKQKVHGRWELCHDTITHWRYKDD